jgi:dTDP-4-dehydrorhamnose reductase
VHDVLAVPPVNDVLALVKNDLDLTKFQAIRDVDCDMSPDLIVNAAAYTDVE